MTSYRCFLVTPTGRGRLDLRRYRSRSGHDEHETCPGPGGYHNAVVPIDGTWPVRLNDPNGRRTLAALPDDLIPHDDSRWPAACTACGLTFADTDRWQVNQHEWYDGLDPNGTGDRIHAVLIDLPPGATYRMPWLDGGDYAGPDGRAWAVRLPPAGTAHPDDFIVYGPASDGQKWEVTGNVPDLTVSPSIQTPRWHGWLQAGVLHD